MFTPERRSRLLEHADIVDMEGFAVAQVCERRGARCLMLKGVSDFAGPTGKEDIRKNMQAVSARLAQAAVAELENLTPGPFPKKEGERFGKLLNFIKFEHSLFSLPLLFAGSWIGAGMHLASWRVLGLIALAGVGARTLGMAMNRIFDRKLDALNPRTAGRELPRGGLTLAQACAVAASGLILYLLACASLGKLCLLLSPLPALPLIFYPLLKRFTCLCHFGIGLCQAIGPPAAFVAASGVVMYDSKLALLALFTFCWMSSFDIIYSLQDLDSDRQTGVHSLPVALGPNAAQNVAAFFHAVAAAAAIALWQTAGAGVCSSVALAIALLALLAGQVRRIPAGVRFFPISAVASIAGALILPLGGLP